MMEHKEGCLGDRPGYVHRVPIGCVTAQDLRAEIVLLSSKVGELSDENMKLKAKLYDLEHDDE